MNTKLTFRGMEISNEQKETILRKAEIFEDLNISNIDIVFNIDKKGVKTKINIKYNKKVISVERIGTCVLSAFETCSNVALSQLEKMERKKNFKNKKDKKNKYKEKSNLDLEKFKFEEINLNMDVDNTYNKSLDYILDNVEKIDSNKNQKIPYLSFENACIQLELLGYDIFYYKDILTNMTKAVYKKANNYLTINM